MKLLSVVGARPNFMKVAPLHAAIAQWNAAHPAGEQVVHRLIHTGQHYDAAMSEVFFRELGLPAPDEDLGIGSASHARQVAGAMVALEEVLLRERPIG